MSDKNQNKKPRKTYTDQFKRDAMKLLSQPGYTLAKTSEALGVSQATRRAELSAKIQRVHTDSRSTDGSPRIHRQLRGDGERVSDKTVAKVMKTLAIQGKYPRPRKPRTTDSTHNKPIASNLLERDFAATGPNPKWDSDITHIDTDEGWLYLAVVIDLFSRKVVGWSTADHMKADLVCEATRNALLSRPKLPGKLAGKKEDDDAALIHHSDRGSQYASGDFQQLLKKHSIVCSMSRKGNCYDNAVAESFFSTLKCELDEPLASQSITHAKLFDYIEVFYNRQRLHSTLNYMSPAAYEAKHQAAQTSKPPRPPFGGEAHGPFAHPVYAFGPHPRNLLRPHPARGAW